MSDIRAIDKLIRYLTKRFDKSDEIYKAIIGDEDAVPEPTIDKSADYNQGAIANELEWLTSYVKQTIASANMNNLSEAELFGWEEIVGIEKASHETISEYVDRVVDIMIGEKHIPYGIEQAMLRYTSVVNVIDFGKKGGFIGASFIGYFDEQVGPPVVRPALITLPDRLLRIELKDNVEIQNPAVMRTIIWILDIIILPTVNYYIVIIP